MKKIIIITIALFSFFSSNAQTDTLGYELVFNQILVLEGSADYATYEPEPYKVIGTVPNGKVWKINNLNTYLTGNEEFYIDIVSDIITRYKLISSSNISFLGEGETIRFRPINTNNTVNLYWVNITEYNKIPIITD